MVSWSVDLAAIEEMDRELTRVIEDFDHAVNVEALCLAKEHVRLAEETGMPSLFQSDKTLY